MGGGEEPRSDPRRPLLRRRRHLRGAPHPGHRRTRRAHQRTGRHERQARQLTRTGARAGDLAA